MNDQNKFNAYSMSTAQVINVTVSRIEEARAHLRIVRNLPYFKDILTEGEQESLKEIIAQLTSREDALLMVRRMLEPQ